MKEEFWLTVPVGSVKIIPDKMGDREVVVFTLRGREEVVKFGIGMRALTDRAITRSKEMK